MRLTNYTTIALFALVGCGVDADDDSGATLRIEPADATQVVTDGQPVTTQYRAFLITADGTKHDVTAETSFALARPELGSWHAAAGDLSLELTGAAVGPSAISASYEELNAEADITVYAHTRIVEGDAALANAPALFDTARADASCTPLVTYPEAGTILPSNLDSVDVQWTDDRNDLYRVSFETSYATVEMYTIKKERVLSADAWAQLASTHNPVSMSVAGIAGGSPDIACTSQSRRLFVTDEPLQGAIYSWSDGGGIWRHDVATRGEPEPLTMQAVTSQITLPSKVTTNQLAAGCAGCAVSKSGARMALRLDNGDGMILDFATDQTMTPMAWRSATFSANADKLVVEQDGVLKLIDETGRQLVTLESSQGTSALDPQLSLDGSMLANVESTGFSPTGTGALVVRSFTNDGDRFGDARVLVAGEPGTASYYPSWSPDGKWLAYTRTTGWGTSSPQSSIWIVKADGSQPPLRLVAPASDVDMAARWVPSMNSVGGEKLYFLSFDSVRSYGAHDVGRQIWMMAFFPKQGLAYPAFHVPFQSTQLSNHVSQWATALVR